jgi:small subunit ribosomal protein S21
LCRTGGVAQLLEIKVENRDVEKAIRLLKRELQKEGILKELKKRRHYEKPSVNRKKSS